MRLLAALLVVLLFVCPAAGAGVSHSAADRADAPRVSDAQTILATATETVSNATDPPESDATIRENTVLRVSIRENGNARWNVTARYLLGDDNETEAFRKLAAEYEDGRADYGLTSATFERIVERVNGVTERPMELREVGRSAQLRNNGTVGVLSLSFTWTNFTRVDDNQIVLGDAFWVGSDTWLPTLNDDQTLVITVPGNYYLSSGSPSGGKIVNGSVLRYDGPQQFERGDFEMTFSPKSTDIPGTSQKGILPSGSSLWGLVVVFLLLTGSFGAYALAQRRGVDPAPAPEPSPTDSPDDAAPSPTMSGASGGDEDETEDGDDEPAPELLSDEERVLRLLRDNDGRMKQGQIVKETNWSNAKVSQLLSKMHDNDDVDKLRIGRENLITLPDEDVTEMD
ncbi:hypothetical protein M0R89_07150 [Halorussus limi]|uniref:HTH iclR-type domain-containing protein n=1 Tax=Halorussus limi TaxID=2938695 RepID=A0A8U0HXM1_9EURY|nr:hypothetical protein [Halorussus limi]UPV75830.1 hypothetical protein M0R89_07150 [Halorussus limi]